LVRRVIELVRGFAGRCAIQSFDEANLYHARELGLSSELGLLVENENALAVTINNPWATVRIDYRLATADVVRALSAQGKVVGVWTVNHREDIERMARLDVDQIITDEPILAMATIAGL
jgi:glycerophosphoryl diester phosphodiesterase